MLHLFKEVGILRQEGKLHQKLITRVRILFVISLILAVATAYNLFFRDADPLIAMALAGIGFFLGLYVFSHMSPVDWNEGQEIVQTGRMGMLGYATIALYIAFEVSLRIFLKDSFPLSSTAFLLAGVFGTIFGRAVGTVVEIHRVFRATHTEIVK